MHLKLLQNKQFKHSTAEATGDLIANKIDNNITIASGTSPKNNSKTNEEEILKERKIYTFTTKI